MNRVAAEIAIEIGVFFQHRHGHAGACEQVTSHHPGRSPAHDHAASLQFLRRAHPGAF